MIHVARRISALKYISFSSLIISKNTTLANAEHSTYIVYKYRLPSIVIVYKVIRCYLITLEQYSFMSEFNVTIPTS
ncbi:hypothetical protein SOVF_172550 [Spinacia oleracea]|nr:hypothetical protein SOVF_172550 [Spinacia oleracea]